MAPDLEKNIKIVKDMFAAFKRGDISTIISYVDEKADWQSPATRTIVKEIPWSKPRLSRAEVSVFFSEFMNKVKIDDMFYSTIVAEGDTVLLEGTMRGSAIATGCFFRSDWMMSLKLRDGKVVRMRHYYDTAEVVAAFLASGEECKALPKAA